MEGYSILSLSDILEEQGEDFCREILSTFSCPKNGDVEKFLTKRSAIDFAKQGIAQTFLVYAFYQGNQVLCGYFTFALKYIIVFRHSISKRTARRLARFAMSPDDPSRFAITAPLIAQLGKNYTNGYNKLITGDELLSIALEKVKEAQMILGGKVVYVECEDVEYLKTFYEQNGFVIFGRRTLDKDEKTNMRGDYLMQLLKYIK